MTKVYCDACGSEINSGAKYIMLSSFPYEYTGRLEYVVCDNCFNHFRELLNNHGGRL